MKYSTTKNGYNMEALDIAGVCHHSVIEILQKLTGSLYLFKIIYAPFFKKKKSFFPKGVN